jgi:hypothetical protein
MYDSLAPEFRPIPTWTWLAVAFLAILVFAVGYDQGQLLRPVLGRAAVTGNYLHALFHDGRHLLNFPCH